MDNNSASLSRFHNLSVAEIRVEPRTRQLNENKVVELLESIERVGLINPISVRLITKKDEPYSAVLVAGNHRLQAAMRLGWKSIDVVILEGDEIDARLYEISENLHRAELSVLEQADHINEWRRLSILKGGGFTVVSKSSPADDEVSQVGTPLGGNQPKDIGIRKTAEALGISVQVVHRSTRVAGIALEAKVAAVGAGLGDNQSALLRIAKAGSAMDQLAVVQHEKEAIQARKIRKENTGKDVPDGNLAEALDLLVDNLTPGVVYTLGNLLATICMPLSKALLATQLSHHVTTTSTLPCGGALPVLSDEHETAPWADATTDVQLNCVDGEHISASEEAFPWEERI